MDITDLGSPVTSPDGHEVDLGVDEGSLDGNLDFLGDLDSETAMSLSVSNSDDSLESGSLTGLGLLLHGEDAHDLVGELDWGSGLVVGLLDEGVDNLGFLDGDGVGVDLLELGDVSVLDESSELGEWGPLLLAESTSTSGSTTTSSASASTAASLATSSSISTSAVTIESFSLVILLNLGVSDWWLVADVGLVHVVTFGQSDLEHGHNS